MSLDGEGSTSEFPYLLSTYILKTQDEISCSCVIAQFIFLIFIAFNNFLKILSSVKESVQFSKAGFAEQFLNNHLCNPWQHFFLSQVFLSRFCVLCFQGVWIEPPALLISKPRLNTF